MGSSDGHQREETLAAYGQNSMALDMRLCPRVYISVSDWAALRPWDRAVVSAVALSIARPATVFTGLTAARLHGLGPAVEPPLSLIHI